MVSADAAHAQNHTAYVIIERGCEHVLCVKGNQPPSHDAVAAAMAADKPHFQSVENGQGSIALIESEREELATGKVSLEQRCYICTKSQWSRAPPPADPPADPFR